MLQLAARDDYAVDSFQQDLIKICGAFVPEPAKHRGDYLKAHLSVNQFAGMDIAHVGLDAKQVLREREQIRRDPGEHFFLILQREGTSRLSQDGVDAHLSPGDMFLTDATQPSMFRYNGAYSLQLSVHLPRQEMAHRFGRRIHGGIRIAENDPLGLSMRALLAKLFRNDDMPQTHVVEAFYSVLGAFLTERELGRRSPLNPDRLLVQKALSVVADRYQETGFTSAMLAAHLGVSPRRLQRAFRLIGETPHGRLQRFRIEAAHTALTSNIAQGMPKTITTLAFDCGFRDLSTFYRLYRKTYGRAPGETLDLPSPDASCKSG
ncbi:MAG: helix-turn-helix domain-containing protein [Pseudomonadota bacterium]